MRILCRLTHARSNNARQSLNRTPGFWVYPPQTHPGKHDLWYQVGPYCPMLMHARPWTSASNPGTPHASGAVRPRPARMNTHDTSPQPRSMTSALSASVDTPGHTDEGGPRSYDRGVVCMCQASTAATCCSLQEGKSRGAALLQRAVPRVQVLCDGLEHVQSHALEAVLPIFRAVAGEAEAILLSMHELDWVETQGGAVAQPSPYVRRLADVCRRFRADFLSHFVPQPSPSVPSFAALLCQRLAGRLLTFFVRHVALLKPLAQPGKLQLAKVRPPPPPRPAVPTASPAHATLHRPYVVGHAVGHALYKLRAVVAPVQLP